MKKLSAGLTVMMLLGSASLAYAGGGGGGPGGGDDSESSSDVQEIYYLNAAQACFINKQMAGQPVICLTIRHKEGAPASVHEAQVCKESLSGAFQNNVAWSISDLSGRILTQSYTDLPGTMCSEWETVNLTALTCNAANYLEATITSPTESADKPEGTYYSGAVPVYKNCFKQQ